MSAELAGRCAIVTGASRGLGGAISEALFAAGADLLLVARSEPGLRALRDKLLSAHTGPQSISILTADLGHPAGPATILAEARRLWPQLDILVNNAGTIGPIGPLAGNDWAAWRETIQINLLAPVELCKLAVDWMQATGTAGSIVNLSGGGATAARPRFSAYATAKCALVRLTETLAAEVAERGIRVNAIAPGAMNTQMLQATLAAGPDLVGREEYDKVTKFAAGEGSDPRVAAALVVFLASAQSAGISGKLISAAWDPWASLPQHLDELKSSDLYTLRRIVPKDRGKTWGDV